MRTKVLPKARKQAFIIYLHLREESLRVATRFSDALAETIALLGSNPRMGRKYETVNPRLDDIRVVAMRVFPLSLSSRTTDKVVEVIAIVHGARDLSDFFDVYDPN